ncbi:hypothetical protein HS088_TW13G00374 [Tripterygium wilfordii]|uniref:Mitochondrial import inner membrane translocase subunit TIM50 n=1 Tax=Tripterygium wilfordii TaxID=458696 RepID=A0A7J7CTS6_TRIWF|nr:uncharacterized protein LOC120013339 [Tripterygium wilfordii]KAF5737493.1 hypothetical protein HS088_TW13G00374 [Tripterygium wilfordii]
MAGKEKIVYHGENRDSEGDDHNHGEEEELELPLEKLSLGPKKKLIVLSLGGVLCERVCRRDTSKIPRNRSPDASYGSMLVYKRPYVEDFIKFCLEKFEVGIWSSAREWYLDDALNCIMSGLRSKLLFAWDQTYSNNTGFSTLENKNKPIFLKELNKIWEKKSLCKGKFSSSNTLLIDVNPYRALLNPPHTTIFPSEYKVNQAGDDALGRNGALRVYLDGLANADNVPSYVKEHPFGQPPVSATHRDWVYYSKIIRSLGKETVSGSGS